MEGVKIEHSEKEKYLGDIIHEKGCTERITETIMERKRKLLSLSADHHFMNGLGQSKTAFNLFEAQIIPCLLHNAESWIGITKKQIKELQDFQDTFIRLVLCSGTLFERRGLDMSGRRGLVEFWRRITVKMAAAI